MEQVNTGGLVLIVAGVFVLAQVLRGDALTKLGITGKPDQATGGDFTDGTPAPAGGTW